MLGAARLGQQPGGGVRGARCPGGQHQLPLQVSAKNGAGTSNGSDGTFTTLPNPLTDVTEPPSSIGQATATLNATVNPNGAEVSKCEFEYGPSTHLRVDRLVRFVIRERASPVSGLGGGLGPVARHRLPLPRRRGERRRRDQRRRRSVQYAPQSSDHCHRAALRDDPDDGDVERDRQSQRRRSQQMRVRIRADERLWIDRVVLRDLERL